MGRVRPKSQFSAGRGGRPTKLTTKAALRIVAEVARGVHPEEATVAVGIGASTYYRWVALAREGVEPFAAWQDAVAAAAAAAYEVRRLSYRRSWPFTDGPGFFESRGATCCAGPGARIALPQPAFPASSDLETAAGGLCAEPTLSYSPLSKPPTINPSPRRSVVAGSDRSWRGQESGTK